MSEKKRLPKPPLYTEDYILMAEILDFALERFGQLILALMYYTSDGTVPDDMPPDLNAMFSIYQKKIDAAREKYEKVCETRAESGAKGGRAKAENTRARSAGQKFKPPTLKQFQDAVTHFVEEGDLPEDIRSYDVDAFFDGLKDDDWTINGEPVRRRSDWENAIQAKFCSYATQRGLPDHMYYSAFSFVFAEYHGLRDCDGKSCAEDAVSDFFDTYDTDAKVWNVQGKTFRSPAWKEAIADFIANYGEFSTT